VDPLGGQYPWYTSYQFSGNNPARFVDLDGAEEANPSLFRKAFNALMGNFEKNRLDAYLTEHNLTFENVIELENDTYVVFETIKNAETGQPSTRYSIFRLDKEGEGFMGVNYPGGHNDDIGLNEKQFVKTRVLGNHVLPGPVGWGSAAKGAGLVLKGAKNSAYTWRGIVGMVETGAKELANWKSQIKFGVLDAIGSSKDLLKKGFHLHF